MDTKELFAKNRDYISSSELDAGLIEGQFVKSETRFYLEIGRVDITSGRVRVGDPLAYLCAEQLSPVMEKEIPAGSYPVEIALVRTAFDGVRICTSRLKIKESRAVRYELARATRESAVFHSSDGDMAAFAVDAGMMAFSDEETAHEYRLWLDKWHGKNPEGNHYDDYFAMLFDESYQKLPQFQRQGGDFIEWAVPDTGHRIVMNATGFGDGLYQCFWGYDENGELCELTVPLIDADDMEKANGEYLKIWDGAPLCTATRHVAEGGKITYMERYEPHGSGDSGWMFFGENEDDGYWNNSDNYTVIRVHEIAEKNPQIIPVLHEPEGAAYFIDKKGRVIPDEGR